MTKWKVIDDGKTSNAVLCTMKRYVRSNKMRLDHFMELANITKANLVAMLLCSLSFTRLILSTILSSDNRCFYHYKYIIVSTNERVVGQVVAARVSPDVEPPSDKALVHVEALLIELLSK
jgi:hypothetical protein